MELLRRSCCLTSPSSSSSSSFRRAARRVAGALKTTTTWTTTALKNHQNRHLPSFGGGPLSSSSASRERASFSGGAERRKLQRGMTALSVSAITISTTNSFNNNNNNDNNGRRKRRLTRTFASYDDEDEDEKWSDLLEQFEKEAAVVADNARNKKIIIPPHKVATLERALAGGRRTFKLNDLANDLGLERRDVTAWMKENQHRQKELAEKYPQEQFRGEDVDEGEDDEIMGLLSNRAKETVRRDKLHDVKAPLKGKKSGPGGMPAYKGFKKTRLGSSNVATLEKIWETGNHYPDDMTIQGIRDATKLPASKIVNWFKEKRDGARNQRHRDARNKQAEKEGFSGRRREGRGGGGGYGKQNHRKQRDVVEDWGDDYD